MQRPKVYITDSDFLDARCEQEIISAAGGELIRLHCKTEDEVIVNCQDAVGLLNQYAPITRRVMESLPQLKVVSRMGIGVDSVDISAATDLNICVTNVPDGSLEEVSNHALALIMLFARKIAVLNEHVKSAGQWEIKPAMPVRRMSCQTLGLLSFGKIAQRLAEKAAALNIKLLVYDPNVPEAVIAQYGAESVSFSDLLTNADYLSVHTPLMPETYHLIGGKELALMKSTAVLINTGRGAVIDEQALIAALSEGRLGGAGLDVLEQEPMPQDSPLRKMKNVIITPHSAWYSEEALIEIRRKTALGVAEILQNQMPTYLVNKQMREKLQVAQCNSASSQFARQANTVKS